MKRGLTKNAFWGYPLAFTSPFLFDWKNEGKKSIFRCYRQFLKRAVFAEHHKLIWEVFKENKSLFPVQKLFTIFVMNNVPYNLLCIIESSVVNPHTHSRPVLSPWYPEHAAPLISEQVPSNMSTAALWVSQGTLLLYFQSIAELRVSGGIQRNPQNPIPHLAFSAAL